MRALNSDFIREIKNTRDRFLSILLLAALAVAFLSGLRAMAPDMKNTLDGYMDARNMSDMQIYSSLGLTQEDVDAVIARGGVSDGEGVYLIDAFASGGDMDMPVKLWSLPARISLPVLRSGRMPEGPSECLADSRLVKEGYVAVGDVLQLHTEGSYEGLLAVGSATVVGVASSPYYISVERGSSTLGNGQASGYIYLMPEAFDMDYYTSALFVLDGAKELTAYSGDYDDLVSDYVDGMESFGEERAALRTENVRTEGYEKLAEAQDELDKGKQELADAEKEINDARRELDDGWAELADARETLARETADAEKKIADAGAELADALAELNDGEDEYADGVIEYEDGLAEYEEALAEIEKNEIRLSEASDDLIAARRALRDAQASIDTGRTTLQEQQDLLDAQKLAMAASGMTPGAIAAATGGAQSAIDSGNATLDAQEAQLAAGRQAFISGNTEYKSGRRELEDAKAELEDAKRELDEAGAELEDARRELDDGWQEYYDGMAELEDARRELRDNIAKADKEIRDAEAELNDGEAEYADGYEEYAEKSSDARADIADAEKKLSEAREDLLDLKDCEWYIAGREAAPSYLSYGQDADRMANLARVFPMLFFVVAALVCLTTMTRMINEQRTQIGCLKALGYSRLSISKKYILYGALPGVFGGLIGLAIGYTVLPKMIFTAWQIMYDIPDIKLQAYTKISGFSVASIIACTALSSLWACFSTLSSSPAALMRPRSPAAGKRVLLEYVRPVWSRMNFFQKVTARNIFRYRKRLIMTIAGISGCTALIIAGFGLRTSLLDTMNNQFGRIFDYTVQITLAEGSSDDERAAVAARIDGDEAVADSMQGISASGTAESPDFSIFSYVQVGEPEDIARFFKLQSYDGARGPGRGEPISLDDSGVIIDQKLSELLGVGVGDSFTLELDSRRTVTVAAINEHYIAHWIYMTPSYYSSTFYEPYEPDSYLLKTEPDDADTADRVMTGLMSMDGVGSAAKIEDTKDTYMHSMERVDLVVVVIILAAAALAFVVLFNLSSINITERRRELATIKVLGFYDGEVSAYVYRENVILTLMGIALGLLLGHWLHVWLVRSVEIDLMMFGRNTDPLAYLWAALLTMLFSVIVNFAAHFSLRKIDMVESLKSAE